ncbi:hypothetical protein [Dokdonella soli]|uniref:hypothetical protein n=1 Tax=Dokdonella soli TaxID=529810 RepID=UPI0036D3CA43
MPDCAPTAQALRGRDAELPALLSPVDRGRIEQLPDRETNRLMTIEDALHPQRQVGAI